MENTVRALEGFIKFFSSVKCGLILLGLVGLATIVGTLLLQRPQAEAGQIEAVYAPQTIRFLDALGLLDVFHAWWFILLLGLLCVSIILASLDRWPQAWRFYARPVVEPDATFLRSQQVKAELKLAGRTPDEILESVRAALRAHGFHPAEFPGGLRAERHRIARLAPYIIHLSLLLIFAGAIIDAGRGYRGFVTLLPGQRVSAVELRGSGGPPRALPFTLRCDDSGMEVYDNGTPRQYWSKLAVEEGGREVFRQQIAVNSPLTYRGIRFFQASFGSSGRPRRLRLEAREAERTSTAQTFELLPGAPATLRDGTRVELADFLPDAGRSGNQLFSRSDELRNPAIQLRVTRGGGAYSAWIFPNAPTLDSYEKRDLHFEVRDVQMANHTGLQVAYQPGQGLIWGGCLLLVAGLVTVLYFSHVRIWARMEAAGSGQTPVLLVAGDASKYREAFKEKFDELIAGLKQSLQAVPRSARHPSEQEAVLAKNLS